MHPIYCDITLISFLSTFVCFETDCSSIRILIYWLHWNWKIIS